MTVVATIRRLGGAAPARELAAEGIGPGLLRTSWNRGEVLRPRKGWYADPNLPREAIDAIRIGGALTCVSAARVLGLWTPEDDGALHVAVPPNAARLRHPGDHRVRLADVPAPVVVHWEPPGARAIVSTEELLVAAARCRGIETAFVLLESALRQGRDVGAALPRMNRAGRRICARAGRRSESGTESLVKLILLKIGVPFRQQVEIPGVGRVDFLVGDRLIIEVDSYEHHADQYRDRKRDAAAGRLGYRTEHYLYAQVVHERHEVEAAIRAAIIRGDHL